MYKISVIIPCVNGLPTIGKCLEALQRQKGDPELQIIVANCCTDETAEYIREHFPEVKLLHFAERLSIPQLRTEGIGAATGEIIAFLEDHCIPHENWHNAVIKGHHQGYRVVSGAVENACTTRIRDWAAFLCEYSYTMPPIPATEVADAAGNNVAYHRTVFTAADITLLREYWEFFWHQRLRERGERFLSAPEMLVYHEKHFDFGYFLRQRFHYSRSFAGMRRRMMVPAKRLYYLLLTPLLPGVMLMRIARQVINKKQFLWKFMLSLPLLSCYMVSYAIGEAVGYTCGQGDSLEKVE